MSNWAKDTRTTIVPGLRYRDAPAAIEWLCRVFGFEKHLVVPSDNDTIAHKGVEKVIRSLVHLRDTRIFGAIGIECAAIDTVAYGDTHPNGPVRETATRASRLKGVEQ